MSAPESFTRSRLLDFQQSTLGDRNGRPCGIYHVVVQAWSVYSAFDTQSEKVAKLLSAGDFLRQRLRALPFPNRPGLTFNRFSGGSLVESVKPLTLRWGEAKPMIGSNGAATGLSLRSTVYGAFTDSSVGALRSYFLNPDVFEFAFFGPEAAIIQNQYDILAYKTLIVFRTITPPTSSSIGHSRPRPAFGRCCVFDVTNVLEKGPGDVEAVYTFRECATEGVEADSVTLGRVGVKHRLAIMPPPLELRVSPNPHWEIADVWPGYLGGSLELGRSLTYARSRVLHAANLPQSVVPPCCNIA